MQNMLLIKEWIKDIKKLQPVLWKEYILTWDETKDLKYKVLCDLLEFLYSYQKIYKQFCMQFHFDVIVTEECYLCFLKKMECIRNLFSSVLFLVSSVKEFLGSSQSFPSLFSRREELTSFMEQCLLKGHENNLTSFISEANVLTDSNKIYQGSTMQIDSLGELCFQSILRGQSYKEYMEIASIGLSFALESKKSHCFFPGEDLILNPYYVMDRHILDDDSVFSLYSKEDWILYSKWLLDFILTEGKNDSSAVLKLEKVVEKLKG